MKARPSPQSNKATDGIFYDKALFSANYPQPYSQAYIAVSVTLFLHLKGLGWDNAKLHCLCMRNEAMQFHMLMGVGMSFLPFVSPLSTVAYYSND